jgi:hypothetical protein
MTMITVASVYQTIYLGLIWLLQKGWSLTYFNIDRDSAASITTAMGGIYIAFSALFVSLPNTFFRYFMQSLIGGMFIYLFYKFIEDFMMTIKKLQARIQGLNSQHVTRDSAFLKRQMYFLFIIPGSLYYLSQIIF